MTVLHRLRRDGVVCSDLDGEIVILDLNTSTYFSVRNSAASLLSALTEGASDVALVESLVAEYSVTPETATVDVREFLDQLAERNLLETAPPV